MSNVGLPARGHGCQYRYITMKTVTDVGLFVFTDRCPLLQSIRLSQRKSVTDIGISAVTHVHNFRV
jgi:hypothetical protein